MRRLLLPIASLLALLLASPAWAVPPTPMLWKLSKDGSSVYLLGSMHFLKAADYPQSADVESAYRQAGQLVFEIAPEEMTSPATAALMLKRGMFQDGKTLQSVLTARTWNELVAYGDKAGMPASRLQMFEPWMVSMTLLALETQKLGLDPASGLDMHFMTLAKADHKTTRGLETADQQFAIFDDAPIKLQEAMLRQSLEEMGDFPKEMGREYDTWRRGDVRGMLEQTDKEFAKYPELYQQILVRRNRAWIPQIERMLAGNKTTLVVVGALHLPGPDGLVKMLQAKGYTVERICTGCSTRSR